MWSNQIKLLNKYKMKFSKENIEFKRNEMLPLHSNGMKFQILNEKKEDGTPLLKLSLNPLFSAFNLILKPYTTKKNVDKCQL